MYTINGICYADQVSDELEISSAIPINNTLLLLTFKNGEDRLFNVNELKGPVFKALKDPKVFKSVNVDSGVVTWLNGEIDCAPEFMYSHCTLADRSIYG